MRLSLSTLVSSTALAATALATPIATKLDKRADFVKRTDDLVWKGNSTLPKVLCVRSRLVSCRGFGALTSSPVLAACTYLDRDLRLVMGSC